ncbi:hypothetical protein R1flu_001590 [Riccia fluitans]|uniref:Uncharacterized protein n=1 Tax=Riccia fluitans TaxID=41844 RepID=A0ABD1Y3V9_9MARC
MYDTLTIRIGDLEKIFGKVVEKILGLIEGQLNVNPNLDAILVVGGFSSSPYLMKRIQEKFSSKVGRILNPVDPGSAVCSGSVAFGAMDAEVMLSRKSRKTYGICSCRAYRMDDPPDKIWITEDGRSWCRDAFVPFVLKGDDIPVDHSVKHEFYPLERADTNIVFDMYASSTSETSSMRQSYVTDRGMELVGSWTYPIPREAEKMAEIPSIEVEMFFGRAMIEVAATPRNFQGPNTMMSVKFERNFF